MKHTAFHWPDHVIGKRESRRIRDQHNALFNSHAELLGALQDALKVIQTAKRYFPKSIKNSDKFHLLNIEANSIRPAIHNAQ